MKIITIESCGECPNCLFDDCESKDRRGLYWCTNFDRECPADTIPFWCPLEDKIHEALCLCKSYLNSVADGGDEGNYELECINNILSKFVEEKD